jgi:hypothetical protein
MIKGWNPSSKVIMNEKKVKVDILDIVLDQAPTSGGGRSDQHTLDLYAAISNFKDYELLNSHLSVQMLIDYRWRNVRRNIITYLFIPFLI